MRTLIDLVATQVEALDAVAKREKRPRAALIREAVDEYLVKRSPSAVQEAFGLRRDRNIDGLAYQRALREEW